MAWSGSVSGIDANFLLLLKSFFFRKTRFQTFFQFPFFQLMDEMCNFIKKLLRLVHWFRTASMNHFWQPVGWCSNADPLLLALELLIADNSISIFRTSVLIHEVLQHAFFFPLLYENSYVTFKTRWVTIK